MSCHFCKKKILKGHYCRRCKKKINLKIDLVRMEQLL